MTIPMALTCSTMEMRTSDGGRTRCHLLVTRPKHSKRMEVRHLLENSNDDKVMQESARYWYSKSSVSLSDDELREAHANLSGFLQILHEWDARSQEQQT